MTKRFLGQHFLKSRAVLEKIIAAADLKSNDTILEIGAGTGILTEALAQRVKKIIAVEKDRRLCELLRSKFASQRKIEVVCGDILKISIPYSLSRIPYKIVANIPYYLTGRLMRLMAEHWPKPALAVLMVQREVAERIVAGPPKLSLLALGVQSWAEAKIMAKVPASAFSPKPKIDSAIIRLIPKKRVLGPEIFPLARLGFGHPRKFLVSNLGRKYPKERILSAFESLGISPTSRPAEISVSQWQALAKELSTSN